MLLTTEYLTLLIHAFKKCKDFIKNEQNKHVLVIGIEGNNPKHFLSIPAFENEKIKIPEIDIYSITEEKYLHSSYIRLSGVFVLFYIVALYLRVANNNFGKEYKYRNSIDSKRLRQSKKVSILKKNSFIFEEDNKGFWYYPISELKDEKLPFIFDLPKINGSSQ